MSASVERDRKALASDDEPVLSSPGQNKHIDDLLEREMPLLVDTYKTLHAAPELSHFEEKTSARIASELRTLGYVVSERVGTYARQEWTGYGVVGLLENGNGPTVLVRTDMDALPVEEKTGLPYASTVKTKTDTGQDIGVMHACGHDIHMTCMLGTARLLAGLQDRWSGTVLMVGQPAEETIDGAKSMLDAGLYEQFRQPDYALALHNNPHLEAGKIGYTPGYFLASANSVDITIRGVGGHGSMPQQTKDPIVIAAQVVLALQSIVSREISPLDPAVVSVGSIHGGTRYNIIPDEVHLQLTVRAYKEDVRKRILASIKRITTGIAIAAGLDEDRLPVVKVNETEFAPATHNNLDLTSRLTTVFRETFGAENVVELLPIMGSEDFGRFGLDGHKIPTFMFWVGAVDPLKLVESNRTGQTLPPLHSNQYAPLPEPTIRTGVKAMTSAVIDLMKTR
jgi:amidohydrolase